MLASHNVLADPKTCSEIKVTYYNPFTGWPIDTPARMAAFEKAVEWRAKNGLYETTNHLIMSVTRGNVRCVYLCLDASNVNHHIASRIETICHVLRTVLEEAPAIVFVVDAGLLPVDSFIETECRLKRKGSRTALNVCITAFATPDISAEVIDVNKVFPVISVETKGIVVWCLHIPATLGEMVQAFPGLSTMPMIREAILHAPKAPDFILGDFWSTEIWHNTKDLVFANTNTKTTFPY